jgi:hypothetical protein
LIPVGQQEKNFITVCNLNKAISKPKVQNIINISIHDLAHHILSITVRVILVVYESLIQEVTLRK